MKRNPVGFCRTPSERFLPVSFTSVFEQFILVFSEMIPRPSRALEREPPRDRSVQISLAWLTARNATTTVLIL